MIWTCLSLVTSLSFMLLSLLLHKLIGNFEPKCSLGTRSITLTPLSIDWRPWYCYSLAPFQHGSPPQWACDTGPSLWQRGPKWCLSWPSQVEFRSPRTLGMWKPLKDANTLAKTLNTTASFSTGVLWSGGWNAKDAKNMCSKTRNEIATE